MCLAVPGQLLEIERQGELAMGKVSFGGVKKMVCLDWVPEVKVGDYVIVHVGFALSIVDEKEALETIAMFEEMVKLDPPPDLPGPDRQGSAS
jgi:hydrogenase expression/formation protein HypC